MDKNLPQDKPHVTAIEALGRAQRHFRFGRGLLIWLGIGFIVGAVLLVVGLAIYNANEVFRRHTDRFEMVDSPPEP
jgi:hypothetical protein